MTFSQLTPLSTEDFDAFVEGIDYPMFIVTTVADGTRAGCLVGFTTQASIDPPRLLVALSDKNHTYRVAQEAELLAVHVVDSDDDEIAQVFGGQTGDDVDKFAQCEWREGPGGVPLLVECPRFVVGRILDRQAYGDHVGHLLEPIEVVAKSSEKSMGFDDVKGLEPGHEA